VADSGRDMLARCTSGEYGRAYCDDEVRAVSNVVYDSSGWDRHGEGRRLTPSLTNSSLRCSRSPTTSRKSIDRSAKRVRRVAKETPRLLTVTRHGHGEIHIQLQVRAINLLIHMELVPRLSVEVFSEIIQHQEKDDAAQKGGEDPTAPGGGRVRRLDLGEGIKGLDGRQFVQLGEEGRGRVVE
jgi:hypothetical protein